MLQLLNGRRVLIAEDEAAVRTSTTMLLQFFGCAVTEAVDGQEALEKLGAADFDLLLTDIRMPLLDGWELAERARAAHPHLPVLYMTGWSQGDRRPVPGGIVLPKPFREGELYAAVAALIGADLLPVGQ